MGQGISKYFRIDRSGNVDPRLSGLAAQKGTLYRFIPDIGDPTLLIKLDDGFSTNWASASAAGELPITVARAGSTANVNVAAPGAAIDGVVLNPGDVVLLKNQAAPAQNGVYNFNGAAVPMTRATQWDQASEFVPGREVFVDSGTVNIDTMWANANYVTTLGVDSITFVRISQSIAVGDPNTLAYFDAAGHLTDNLSAQFTAATNSLSFAIVSTGGTCSATGNGSIAFGQVSNNASITASQPGTIATGQADGNSQILAQFSGARAHGFTQNAGNVIANAVGAHAFGASTNSGVIRANNQGSQAFGVVDGNNSQVLAGGNSSSAQGSATNGGVISTGGAGAVATGSADGAASLISASAAGTYAFGTTSGGGQILSSGGVAFGDAETGGIIRNSGGGLAFGFALGAGSLIQLTNDAGIVCGDAESGGQILGLGTVISIGLATNAGIINSSGQGIAMGVANAGQIQNPGNGIAMGSASGAGSLISIGNGNDSFAMGTASGGGQIKALGDGCFAMGVATVLAESVNVTGDMGFALGTRITHSAKFGMSLGLGITNSSYQALMLGQYNDPAAYTAGASVATDPLFLLGNGTGVGTEHDAFRIDKDGKVTETGANRVPVRVVAGNTVLSARSDRKIVFNDNSGIARNVTLPPGEEGLTFQFCFASANTSTWAPVSGDAVDPAVTSVLNATVTSVSYSMTFTGGTWYLV